MNIDYKEYFNCFDIKNSQSIVIASDITPLAYFYIRQGLDFQISSLIDTLKSLISPEQTVLIPTYSWDFCKGKVFDYKNSKSQVGVLGDYALKDKDFKRTKHPIYSFAVYGKDKDKLCALDYKSSFGKESLFDYMYKTNALHIGIGIDFNLSYTFMHYVEEVGYLNQITYRYMKTFTSKYIDENGNESVKDYSMLVRDLDKNVRMHLAPLGQEFIDKNIMKTYSQNGIHLYSVDVYKSYDVIKNDILYNNSRLFCIYDGQ